MAALSLRNIIWDEPATDEGWAEDVKEESLHLKFNSQLTQMKKSLTEKLPLIEKDLYWIEKYPDAKRKELEEHFTFKIVEEATPQFEGQALIDAIEVELASETNYLKWKIDKIKQSIKRIEMEQDLRKRGVVERDPIGTTFYVDFDNGNDGSAGTAIGTAWATLDKFCENARSAGDKCIVRRGMIQTVTSDLTMLSDGTITNPIILEADYGDAWSDFANSAQTYTVVYGQKTMTASANITGITAGDWIYVTSDTAKDYSYEVASVSGTTLTLYLNYKGGQAGSTKTLVVMPHAPIWNTAAGDYQVNPYTDYYWLFQGMHFRGTDVNGVMYIRNTKTTYVKDCIIEGNGTDDTGIKLTPKDYRIFLDKCRFYNYAFGVNCISQAEIIINDCLFNGNDIAWAVGVYARLGLVTIDESEFKNQLFDLYGLEGNVWYVRNCLFEAESWEFYHESIADMNRYYVEDYNNVIGDNRQYIGGKIVTRDAPNLQSETTIVRAGGGSTSIKVTPSVQLSTTWKEGRELLFEYPIYADTTSKTYTVHFKSSGTGNWTVDPTNTELWIEAEYWGHAANNHRMIIKSTGVCDFNGDDVNWLTLTVTVQPAQTGVLYLRCWYCKTKEAGSNIFYVDAKPIIS